MPISAEQWKVVVGSNNVRRLHQVSSTSICTNLGLLNQLFHTFPETASSLVSVCVMCAESVSHSIVTMLLLLLAGDVESNPGPGKKRSGPDTSLPIAKKPSVIGGTDTPEYQTIKDCTKQLTTLFKHDLLTINDHLWAKGMLSEGVRGKLSERNFGQHERATVLVDYVTDQVRDAPSYYHKLVTVVNKLGPWASDTAQLLKETYASNNSNVSQQRSNPTPDTDSRIDDIAEYHGVSPQSLDVPCASHHLEPISKLIVHWRAYCNYLGLSKLQESHINSNPSFDLAFAKPLMMLEKWQEQKKHTPKSHYRYLLRGCIHIEQNAQLVGDICKIMIDPKYIAPTEDSEECQDQLCGEDSVPHAFCEMTLLDQQPSSETVGSDPALAQVACNKLWSIDHGGDMLKVYIMNPADLQALDLNPQNVLAWAKKWEHPSYKAIIPKFALTSDASKSNIRVKIAPNAQSKSSVGIDAESVPKSKPTMVLGLIKGDHMYNDHIGVHEFGHALGLEHEHQRSEFWSIAKPFIDVSKIKKQFPKMNVKDRYLECKQFEIGIGSAEYDPDSVMHYWFSKYWINSKHYQSEQNIIQDQTLSVDQKKVLRGIHKRHHNCADSPSAIDFKFLATCYKAKQSTSSKHGPISESMDVDELDNDKMMQGNENPLHLSGIPADDIERDRVNPKLDSNKQPVIKIGIIGATNSGKSTTLNALLRGRFLPTSSGGTTAHVLCIKNCPGIMKGELYELEPGNKVNRIATGEEDIYAQLESLNESQRADQTHENSLQKLQLRIEIPFLQGLNLELYDTPGTSEDESSQMYKDAKCIQDQMERLILVLSQDTVMLAETTNLLIRLRNRFPSLMSPEKLIVLMNKYDLFFEDRQKKSLADQKLQIGQKIEVDLSRVDFYSAKIGLEARCWQEKLEAVDDDSFENLKVDIKKIPKMKEQVKKLNTEQLSFKEKVEQLSEMGENSSCIKAVEERILTMSSMFAQT